MVKASELRVGNWIIAGDTNLHGQVEIINKPMNEVWLVVPETDYDSWDFDFDQVLPIPLTPDILEQCGFKELSPTKYRYNNLIIRRSQALTRWYYLRAGGWSTTIESLHKLQNLYFALTGEEIIYQPIKATV